MSHEAWLSYSAAAQHAARVPDPTVSLRRLPGFTPDRMVEVLLPDGSIYKLRSGHLSKLPPHEQRRLDEEFAG